MGFCFFSQGMSDRIKGNGNFQEAPLEVAPGEVCIRENFFIERVFKNWNRLTRDVVETP